MTAALGNGTSPDNQQGSGGPFNRWPTGLGFDYFWGFLGGEAGQYDPLITENQKAIGVPERTAEPYYFPDDLAEKTIDWLHRVRAEKPTPVVHLLRDRLQPRAPPRSEGVGRQVQGEVRRGLGRPARARRSRARRSSASSRPTRSCAAQRRLPDVGLAERDRAAPLRPADGDLRGLLGERGLERRPRPRRDRGDGELDNTLVIWIWGDNGASLEGTLSGTFNEMTTLNGIPLTPEQQMGLLFKHGGLEAWGGDLMAPHYSAAWAWASNTPFDWGKQVASHLGGTRTRSSSAIRRDLPTGCCAEHFTHVIDVARRARARGHPGADARRRDRAGACTGSRSPTRCPTERAGAAHAAVLRGGRQPGDVQGRLVARDAPAAHPWLLDPEALRTSARAGTPTTTRSSSTTCPTTSPRRRTWPTAPREGRGAAEALGRGGALPGAADPGRARPSTGSCRRSPRSRSSRTAARSRTSPPG